jgi:serine/threonine protein phosphatase PrpC
MSIQYRRFPLRCLHNSQVFDGHGGKDDVLYVRDNLSRVIVEDASTCALLRLNCNRSYILKHMKQQPKRQKLNHLFVLMTDGFFENLTT